MESENRLLVRCYLILSQGNYHYADVRDFEQAAQHGATVDCARSYWSDYDPERIPIGVTEIVADSALYFPDWETFPEIDVPATAAWNSARQKD